MQGIFASFAAALFALTLGVEPVAGQGAGYPDLIETLDAADSEGEFLRLTTTEGRQVAGYIRRLDDRVIRLGGGAVELEAIERVEARSRNRPGLERGAVMGAIIGGVALGAIGVALSGLYDDSADWLLAGSAAVIGALLGGSLGGAFGHSIDPGGEPEWTLLWSR